MQSWKSWSNTVHNSTSENRLVPVGRVLRAHGTSGEMLIYPYLNDLAYYESIHEVVIPQKDAPMRSYGVCQVRPMGERILLQLDGCSSPEEVRSLSGLELFVPRDELPPPGEGEFYWFDLEGLAVYTQEGTFLGRVEDFFPTGSNEVLVVRDGARETLLPFIKDIILAVDHTQGCLRVRTVPGLLE